MKKLLLLPCLLLLLSCSSYKYRGMEIVGDGRNCFTKDDIKTLVVLNFEADEELTTYMAINPNIVVNNGCIGLYDCIFTGIRSNIIVLKVLKFEDKVYMFDEDNLQENEQRLNEFLEQNKHLFSETDLKKLIAQFEKGTEYKGTFF